MLYYTDPNGISHQFKNSGEMNQFVDDNFPEEVVTEETALFDTKNKFSVNLTPDANYNLGPEMGYFKWVNHIDFLRADEIARIKFKYPEYVKHNGKDGKKTVTLSSKQKKILIQNFMKGINKKASCQYSYQTRTDDGAVSSNSLAIFYIII